jgi:GT2 family glycosyltransferase
VRFSVVVATRNRPDELREALRSIAGCEPPPFEIVVVDGDDGRSAEPVVEEFGGDGIPRVLYSPSPPGLSVQRNRGVAIASGEALVFLDDDVTLDPGFFRALAEAYEDGSVVGATGRVIEPQARHFGAKSSRVRNLLFPGGREGSMTEFGYPRRILDPDRERDVEWMQGCCMSARAEAARTVPHDERIPPEFEGEDEDFSYRLSRLGRLRYVPGAVLHHRQLGFRHSRGRSFDRNVVLARTFLFRKNFRRTTRTRLQFAALIAILLVHRLMNREWDGARGVLDGVVEVWKRRKRGLLSPGE